VSIVICQWFPTLNCWLTAQKIAAKNLSSIPTVKSPICCIILLLNVPGVSAFELPGLGPGTSHGFHPWNFSPWFTPWKKSWKIMRKKNKVLIVKIHKNTSLRENYGLMIIDLEQQMQEKSG
jgi:hypothetical protein